MRQDHDQTVTMQVVAAMPFLPVVVQSAETVAGIFGLGREESLKLGLATEEIFSYLSSKVCPGKVLDIHCVNGISYARVEFRFPVSVLDMGALNIAASIAWDNEDNMTEAGLAIATRSIERLSIVTEGKSRICLSIEKDKIYPEVTDVRTAPLTLQGDLRVETPDPEGVKRYVTGVAQGHPDPIRPPFFKYPGRVVDMVAAGDCQVLTVMDSKGECAGGMLFHFMRDRIIEIFGPHVFTAGREEEIAGMLLDACIAKTARTKAIALVSLTGSLLTLETQFERLGVMKNYSPAGEYVDRPAYYRLLHEDPGCQVFTDRILKDYLQREYDRLFLAREIREVTDQGETRSGASIFSAAVYRERSIAILLPLWPGDDYDANVKRHQQMFKEEDIRNIFFNLDLGVSWQASLMTVLMSNHFRPVLIIPFAGQADLLVFQYDSSES